MNDQIQADINNKLQPIANLLAMLGEDNNSEEFNNLLNEEIERAKLSVEYLKNLYKKEKRFDKVQEWITKTLTFPVKIKSSLSDEMINEIKNDSSHFQFLQSVPQFQSGGKKASSDNLRQ
jgi:hypothetical protein